MMNAISIRPGSIVKAKPGAAGVWDVDREFPCGYVKFILDLRDDPIMTVLGLHMHPRVPTVEVCVVLVHDVVCTMHADWMRLHCEKVTD
jgi:hypothetical protein